MFVENEREWENMRYTIRLCIQSRKLLRQRLRMLLQKRKRISNTEKPIDCAKANIHTHTNGSVVGLCYGKSKALDIKWTFLFEIKFCKRKWEWNNRIWGRKRKKPTFYSVVYAFVRVFFS